MEESKKVQRKAAYSIQDRGEGKDAFWHLIGTAFVCKDLMWSARLCSGQSKAIACDRASSTFYCA